MSAECRAQAVDGVFSCAACGYRWPEGERQPAPCSPIGFEAMKARLWSECTRAEASLGMVESLAATGMPADPAPARRRLAELERCLRLVELVAGDAALRTAVKEKNKVGRS